MLSVTSRIEQSLSTYEARRSRPLDSLHEDAALDGAGEDRHAVQRVGDFAHLALRVVRRVARLEDRRRGDDFGHVLVARLRRVAVGADGAAAADAVLARAHRLVVRAGRCDDRARGDAAGRADRLLVCGGRSVRGAARARRAAAAGRATAAAAALRLRIRDCRQEAEPMDEAAPRREDAAGDAPLPSLPAAYPDETPLVHGRPLHGFFRAKSRGCLGNVERCNQLWLSAPSLEVGRANRALAPTLKSADAGVERLRAAWG